MYIIDGPIKINLKTFGASLLIAIVVGVLSSSYAAGGRIGHLFDNTQVSFVTIEYRCAVEFKNINTIDTRYRIPIPQDSLPLELPKDKVEWTLIRKVRITKDSDTLKRMVNYFGVERNNKEKDLIISETDIFMYPLQKTRLSKSEDYDMLRDEILGMEWMPTSLPFYISNGAISTLTLPVKNNNPKNKRYLGSYTCIETVRVAGVEIVNGEKCKVLEYEITLRVPESLTNTMLEEQAKGKPGGPIYKNYIKVIVTGRVLFSEKNGIIYSRTSKLTKQMETMEIEKVKKNPKAKPKETRLLAIENRTSVLKSYKIEYK